MFERFTDRARKALSHAKQLAIREGHKEIRPAHVIHGILQEGNNVANTILRNLRVRQGDAFNAAFDVFATYEPTRLVGQDEERTRSQKLDAALHDAIAEAKKREHNYVGTEHVMLALLKTDEGSLFCKNLNLDWQKFNQTIDDIMSGKAVVQDLIATTAFSPDPLAQENAALRLILKSLVTEALTCEDAGDFVLSVQEQLKEYA